MTRILSATITANTMERANATAIITEMGSAMAIIKKADATCKRRAGGVYCLVGSLQLEQRGVKQRW